MEFKISTSNKNICCSPGWQDPDPALRAELGIAPATELLLHRGAGHGAGEAQAEVVLLDPALSAGRVACQNM